MTLEASDGSCSSVYSRVINVRDGLQTSSSELGKNLDILVYPNPSQNGTIYIESGSLEMKQIRLFNLSGMLLLDKQVNGLNNYRIDQQDNPPGVYFLQINTDRGLIVRKITF